MRNFFLILLFLLTSCGYQPLFTNKNANDFIFKEIEFKGDKEINRSLISSTFIKKDQDEFTFEKIIFESKKKVIETSKDSKGRPESFRMTIDLIITIIDNGKIVKNKTFSDAFSYKNLDNKFNLSEYENNVQNNLIEKITNDFLIYLNL